MATNTKTLQNDCIPIGTGGSKRNRIRYSLEQRAIFEENYSRSKFLSTIDRNKLAEQMGLDPKRLKYWWRNRRAKERSTSQMASNYPKRKRNVSQSISDAPTPSPSPSSSSVLSSCPDQRQSSHIHTIEQPIYPQFHGGWLQYQDLHSTAYQQALDPYMARSNPLLMNEQIAPHPYANTHTNAHTNEMGMVYNATNLLVHPFTPSQYYYDENIWMNAQLPYSNDASTQFTQFDQQVGKEPQNFSPSNRFEETNTNCNTTFNGLRSYWQQLDGEFFEYQ